MQVKLYLGAVKGKGCSNTASLQTLHILCQPPQEVVSCKLLLSELAQYILLPGAAKGEVASPPVQCLEADCTSH